MPQTMAAAWKVKAGSVVSEDLCLVAGAQNWRWQDKKKQRTGNAAPSPGRPGVVKDDRKSVYVRNLPFRATEEDLDNFFSQVGRVVDVRRGANSEGVISPEPKAR